MNRHTVPTSVAVTVLALLISSALALSVSAAPQVASGGPSPRFSTPAAFDVSRALRDIASSRRPSAPSDQLREVRPERGPVTIDRGFSGDGAVQGSSAPLQVSPVIAAPLVSFEGLSNQDNLNTFGFRVNPPDPVGDVGPNHYVEMANLVFAVYSKTGALLH